MKASHNSPGEETRDLNQLQRGGHYRLTTRQLITVGEYLGIEVPHGDRAILLRGCDGTASVAISDLISIQQVD